MRKFFCHRKAGSLAAATPAKSYPRSPRLSRFDLYLQIEARQSGTPRLPIRLRLTKYYSNLVFEGAGSCLPDA